MYYLAQPLQRHPAPSRTAAAHRLRPRLAPSGVQEVGLQEHGHTSTCSSWRPGMPRTTGSIAYHLLKNPFLQPHTKQSRAVTFTDSRELRRIPRQSVVDKQVGCTSSPHISCAASLAASHCLVYPPVWPHTSLNLLFNLPDAESPVELDVLREQRAATAHFSSISITEQAVSTPRKACWLPTPPDQHAQAQAKKQGILQPLTMHSGSVEQSCTPHRGHSQVIVQGKPSISVAANTGARNRGPAGLCTHASTCERATPSPPGTACLRNRRRRLNPFSHDCPSHLEPTKCISIAPR